MAYRGTHAERKAYWKKKQQQRDDQDAEGFVYFMLFCLAMYVAMWVVAALLAYAALRLVVTIIKFIHKQYQLYKDPQHEKTN